MRDEKPAWTLTRAEARTLDRRAIDEFAVPGVVLMENAGRGMAELLRTLGVQGPVAILCGKGNNGGDGFVIARHLDNAHLPVRVLLLARAAELAGDAAVNHTILTRGGVTVEEMPPADYDPARVQAMLAGADWVVDALFGSGLEGAVRPPFDQLIEAIHASRARVFAVDIPSGLNADTGQPLGVAVRAHHTATVVAPKRGFLEPGADTWLGQVHVIDMGAPRKLLEPSAADPIELLFGGMAKLGPGGDAHTLHVLRLLPRRQFQVVVDVGCGTGRQTLVLARELGTPIDALDTHQPFLTDLQRRAGEAGLASLIRAHLLDMKDLPGAFPPIDLLWCEGAAYHIGFANALSTWAPALAADGFLVVSELCWLRADAPPDVQEFFRTGYPAMQSVEQNLTTARNAGYRVLDTYTLPREAWVEGYYDILAPRAQALLGHPDPTVRDFAADMLREINLFAASPDSYGYVFYLLQRV